VSPAFAELDPVRPPESARGTPLPASVLWLVAAGAIAAVIYLFRRLALPLILAVLLAYLLSPLVRWVHSFGIRRAVAVGAVFGALALVLAGIGSLVVPRVRADGFGVVERLPALVERGLSQALHELAAAAPSLARRLPQVSGREGWLIEVVEGQAGHASGLLGHAGSLIFVGALTPFFSFFLLRDGRHMLRYVLDRLHPRHVETSLAVWSEIDEIIGRYLRGVALDGLAVGILAGIGLWIIGVPHPILLGAFTAVVNPVPYLCTLLGMAAASIVALAEGLGLRTVVLIALLYVAIRVLDDLLIAVLTVGKSVHLHPVLLVVSILAGEHALGILGMAIAVPVVTVVKETVRLLLEHRRTLQRPVARVTHPTSGLRHYAC
jgi:predicted PurR-regulated permease PerM